MAGGSPSTGTNVTWVCGSPTRTARTCAASWCVCRRPVRRTDSPSPPMDPSLPW